MTCENDLIDQDTGEPESHPQFLVKLTAQEDCETGEHTKEIIKFKKSTFKIPQHLLKKDETSQICPAENQQEKKKKCCVKILAFCLPTLLLLPSWATVVYLICETVFHVWSHKQKNMNRPTIKYNSPLSGMFSECCAECQFEKQMRRVGKLQDERTKKVSAQRLLNNVDCVKNVGVAV